ncbi:hypothetical protein [[Erwinia] mediterraneensis]|uniref:hypothetical protein n=1 Tax=[Erwinia] mediterraneensis TaxID=2161819 RepID=UPI001031BC50|nr:hypothetical protein [[Erwinia] mediterraneensis]
MCYFKRLDVHKSFLILKLFIKNHQKTDSFTRTEAVFSVTYPFSKVNAWYADKPGIDRSVIDTRLFCIISLKLQLFPSR